jgi:hypothetical protein
VKNRGHSAGRCEDLPGKAPDAARILPPRRRDGEDRATRNAIPDARAMGVEQGRAATATLGGERG